MASSGAPCWRPLVSPSILSERVCSMITTAVFDTKPYDREALSDIARTTVANLEALAAGQAFVDGSVLT
jgi:hypothetical protein